MNASDLPADAKRQLAKEIERQVGSANYRKMVDQVGEDKVIDFVIENAQESTRSRSSSEPKKDRWWVDLLTTIGGWLAFAYCLEMGKSSQIYLAIGVVILLLLIFQGTGIWAKVKGSWAKLFRVVRKSAWLLIPYALGMALIGQTNKLVYHLVAIPLGLAWMWAMSR